MSTPWYYTRGRSDRQGPVPEEALRSLVSGGTLKAGDLAWREGMPDWMPVGKIPELQDATVPLAYTEPARALPARLAGWMSFVGIMTIITGVLYCLTCVGLIVGILMVIAGASLLAARTAMVAAPPPPSEWAPFFSKLNAFMALTGVVYILAVVGGLLMVLVSFGSM